MQRFEEQIEEMRRAMLDAHKSELHQVQALDKALIADDRAVLDAIREMRAKHHARRADIAGELVDFASEIGRLPRSFRPHAAMAAPDGRAGSADAAPARSPLAPDGIDQALASLDRLKSSPRVLEEPMPRIVRRQA